MVRLGAKYRVEELVPHRGPMSLLDAVEDYGLDWLRAVVTPHPGARFATPSGVPGWVGIEYMAQAASAFGGIEQVQRGDTPTIGLLIGARYYRCMQDSFSFGRPLTVIAKIALRDADDFVAYDCRIERDGLGVAECTLKAYRPSDIGTLLGDAAGG